MPSQSRARKEARGMRSLYDRSWTSSRQLKELASRPSTPGCAPVKMLALRWSDLVLDDPEPVARVRRSLSTDDEGRLVVKSTKTERGRAIALLPQVVEALRAHRKWQAEQRLKYSGLWRDEDLVFS